MSPFKHIGTSARDAAARRLGHHRMRLVPGALADDRGVLAGVGRALVHRVAEVDAVGQHLVDRGLDPGLAAAHAISANKLTTTQLDVSGVGTRGGEFVAGQLEAAVDRDPITQVAVDEIVAYGQDRRSWLLFCAGVDHARHVCDAVRSRGISCATIFGHTPKAERDRIVAAFKRGEIRTLASMGVLTTGFNAPAIDLIAMLRPTKSTGLYVQMAGRGTRPVGGTTMPEPGSKRRWWLAAGLTVLLGAPAALALTTIRIEGVITTVTAAVGASGLPRNAAIPVALSHGQLRSLPDRPPRSGWWWRAA